MRRLHEHSEDGFTLVEILVVVVIIGILAAIAIPALLNQRRAGFDAQAVSDLRNLIPVQQGLRAESGTFSQDPAAFDDWRQTDGTIVCVETFPDDTDREVSLASWHPQGSLVYSWTSTSRLISTVSPPPADCTEVPLDAPTQIGP